MAQRVYDLLAGLIERNEQLLRDEWMASLRDAGALRTGQISDAELSSQIRNFMRELRAGVSSGVDDIQSDSWEPMRRLLNEISRSRGLQGYSPTETAMFVLSLKEPVFNLVKRELSRDANTLGDVIWAASRLIDKLGLFTTEAAQRERDEVIARQGRELLELSTPVVQLWDKILALPLIGTLDSERTQIVMERLLQSIVEVGAEIAIIDISGVPTVDTLVAQHLIKTVSAARLMGADCIISGIRPQIAQTIVHLGVDLGDVVTRATLSDALQYALQKLNLAIRPTDSAAEAG